MTPEQWQQVREAYEAVAAAAPDQPAATLAEVCGDDAELRAQVERLLDAGAQAGEFLERPPLLDPAALPAVNAGRRIGPYQILSEIGQGGMSTVYLAVRADAAYEQQVAIKLLWPGLRSRDLLRRFRQERQILADLDHPNIARLLDGGTTAEGWPYLVMEYIAGVPLTEYCETQRATLDERLRLFRAVCAAVEYAHQHDVIHRDLKPSNILVTPSPDGKDGTVKLLDFGIAKLLKPDSQAEAATLTQSALHLLTPDYASPEQIRNEEITRRSDVYSLGVLLYELLTGVRPYRIQSLLLHEITRAICEVEPERPSRRLAELARAHQIFIAAEPAKLRRQLTGDLDNIVMTALAKEAARRYRSAEQLSEDIARYLDGQPVTARPQTLGYRVGKFVQRHRVGVVISVSLMLMLLMGAGFGLWRAREIAAQQRQARRLAYAGHMKRALENWESGNLVFMEELLDGYLPSPGAEELRGFEWYYLWRLLHLERLTWTRDDLQGPLAFSPNGRQFTVGCAGGAVVLDAATGKLLFQLKAQSPRIVFALAFSPDGAKLATAGNDHTVKLWDTNTGQEFLTLREQGDNAVLSVAFSPDGRRLLTGATSEEARLWDAATGRRLALLKGSFLRNWSKAKFSPDGQLIASWSGSTIKLWDAVTLHLIASFRDDETDTIDGITFSPDSRQLATGGFDKTVKLWEVATQRKLRTFRGHTDDVYTVAFTPDGHTLASAGNDTKIKLWNVTTGREIATLKGHKFPIAELAFAPDSRSLASYSTDRAVKLWDWQSLLKATIRTGHTDQIWSLAYAPDGRRIVTGSRDGTAEIHDFATGQTLALTTHTNQVHAVALTRDGKLVATASRDQTVKLWDIRTGKEQTTLKGHTGPVRSLAFSPDGDWLVSGSDDLTSKLWRLDNYQEVATLRGHTDGVWAIAFSPDQRWLATGGRDHTIKLWDWAARREIATLRGHRFDVWSLAFSPDGRLLASGNGDRTVKLWEIPSGRELATLKGHADEIFSVAFSLDGRRLVTASKDHTLKVWDVPNRLELLTLREHTDEVAAVAFSPDGATVASGSYDRTIRLWRAATEEEVQSGKR